MVLGVPCYSMDTWTGGWHSLFLVFVGQSIRLLCLAGFTICNPHLLGRARIQEVNYIGAMSKGSKTKHQQEHRRFDSRTVCLAPALSFKQVHFAEGFCLLQYEGLVEKKLTHKS